MATRCGNPTPIYQTIEHKPEEGRYGNCMQAAIATILGLPLDAVPHFADGMTPDAAGLELFNSRLISFLAEFGMFPWSVPVDQLPDEPWDCPPILHLISGLSERGHPHAVVGLNGRPIHDPYPDGGGVGPDSEGRFWIMFAVPFDAREIAEIAGIAVAGSPTPPTLEAEKP